MCPLVVDYMSERFDLLFEDGVSMDGFEDEELLECVNEALPRDVKLERGYSGDPVDADTPPYVSVIIKDNRYITMDEVEEKNRELKSRIVDAVENIVGVGVHETQRAGWS